MIVVRDVFQLKFGLAKDAQALMREAAPWFKEEMPDNQMRVLVDVTGPSYTLVLEVQYKSLGDFEQSMSSDTNDTRWQDWYERFKPLCQSSYREILRTIDL